MGIYSTRCEKCNEGTKCQIELHRYRDEKGKIYQGYMYECENVNCEIQRTVKKEIRKCYGINRRGEKRRPEKRYRNRSYRGE